MRRMLRPFFVLLCLVVGTQLMAQTAGDYRTDQTGNWTTLTTWERFDGAIWQKLESTGFLVPASTDGAIELRHNVTINTAVTADQVTVSAGTTTVSTGSGVFNIVDGIGDDVTATATGTISVTTGSMSFAANSTYVHARNAGSIPLATWGNGSTVTVTGTTTTSPTVNTASVFWNFIYDCPGQSGAENILIRDIQGDLIINDTGDNLLRFGTTTGYTLNIDGNFDVGNSGAGSARVAFGTSAPGVIVNLTGDFNYNSAGTFSQLIGTGSFTFSIGGDVSITGGSIRMATGGNTGIIEVAGNFELATGTTIDETGNGSRQIVFNGTTQQSLTALGTITGQIDFEVDNTADVLLASGLTVGGALTQTQGNLILNANILTLNGIFTQTAGSLVVDPTAEFIIGGTGTLPAAISFSGIDLGRLRMNRTGGTLASSSDLTLDFLDLYAGAVTHSGPGTLTIVDGGTIERRVGTLTNPLTADGVYNLVYNNSTAAVTTGAELPISPNVLNDLTIQGGQTVNLNNNITINGDLTTTAGVFAAAAFSIDLEGDFISNAGFTTTAGGNFTVSGLSSTLTGGGSTPVFRNLFVPGSFSTSVNFQVNENLNVSGTLNATGGTASFGGTASVITNSGSLTFFNFDLLTASTVTFPTTTVRVNGNFDISTGTSTFNNGGGTIEFGGITNLLGTGAKTFNNVSVLTGSSLSGAVSVTLNGALVNDGTLSFTAGVFSTNNGSISGTGTTTFFDMDVVTGTLTQATGTTISLRDDFDISAGATFTAGANSTVSFITATCLITGTGTKNFSNIDVPSGGTLSHGVIVNVAGNITVDGTLANGTGTTVFNGGGASTISGSGTIGFDFLTVNAGTTVNATSNISVTDDIIANGSFTSTQGVTIASATTLSPASGSFTVNNFTINPAVTFTPNDDMTINGNLVVNGTLSDGTANAIITFNGNTTVSGTATAINFPFVVVSGTLNAHPSVTMNIERNFTNNGTFNHNGGTINFTTTGTNQQQILGSNPIVFNNLSVSNVGQATDLTNGNAAGITIVGTLSFTEGTAVFDADGAGSNLLTLASSADSPAVDGRIGAIPAGSNVSGNFTVERYVSSENRIYRYISVPVVGATVAQLKAGIPVTGTFTDPSDGSSTPPCVGCITTNPSLFFYDEATQAYVAYPASGLASAASLTNGRGYSAFFRHTGQGAVGTVTLSFRGTNPSATGVTLPVAPAAGNYALVGNPYPSAIDWASATGWSVRTGFSNIAVVRDNATGVHQFLDANSASPQLIAPGQSFWVQTLVGGSSLTVNEAAKAAGNYSFFRLDQPTEDILELTLTKGTTGTTDNARIVIRDGSTAVYDMYDAYKFNNNIDNGSAITEVQDISTLTVEATPKALAVNAIPSMSCTQTFNVRVTNFVNSGETVVNYTLAINPTGAMKAMQWMLHDNYTNADYDLTANGAYAFTVDNGIAASKANNRFVLTAVAPTVDTNKTLAAQSPTACAGSDAMITLAASQQGIAYGVEVNGTYYPNVVMGNGSDVNIFIDNDKLQNGSNTISVKANSGCQVMAVGSPVQITQVEIYQAAAVSPPAQCASGTFTLTASGAPNDAEYRWYDAAGSTTVLATGPEFSPTVYTTRSYFVAAVNPAGCEGSRVEVVATVGDLTADVQITASAQAVCKGENISFTNTSSSGVGNFLWFESPAQDAIAVATVASGETYSPAVFKNTTYYVRYSPVPGCVGDAVEVQASVITFNPALTISSASAFVCKGQSHTLTVSGAPAGSRYIWYDISGDSVGMGTSFSTGALMTSTNYKVAAYGPDGCKSDLKLLVAEVDESSPSVNVSHSLSGATICQDTEVDVTLTNTDPGLIYRWYESGSSTAPIYEGTTLPATVYGDNQSYFVGAVNTHGCETASASRKEIKVTVTKFAEPVLDNSVYGVLKSTTAQAYQWYVNGDPLAGEQDQTIRVFDPGYYAVKVDLQGCEAWSNTIFTTDMITSLTDESRVIRFFPNPVSDKLTVHVLGNEPITGQLLDEQGRSIAAVQLMQGDGQWSGELDVRSLARGFYLLRLSSGTRSVTHKVIIK